jgi:hypothetical protein
VFKEVYVTKLFPTVRATCFILAHISVPAARSSL